MQDKIRLIISEDSSIPKISMRYKPSSKMFAAFFTIMPEFVSTQPSPEEAAADVQQFVMECMEEINRDAMSDIVGRACMRELNGARN